jgi:hypothetical protein
MLRDHDAARSDAQISHHEAGRVGRADPHDRSLTLTGP